MMLTLLGTSFLCLDISRLFQINVRTKTSLSMGDWALVQNAVYFPKLKTYLTKTKHSSFSFTILTNLIVAK